MKIWNIFLHKIIIIISEKRSDFKSLFIRMIFEADRLVFDQWCANNDQQSTINFIVYCRWNRNRVVVVVIVVIKFQVLSKLLQSMIGIWPVNEIPALMMKSFSLIRKSLRLQFKATFVGPHPSPAYFQIPFFAFTQSFLSAPILGTIFQCLKIF